MTGNIDTIFQITSLKNTKGVFLMSYHALKNNGYLSVSSICFWLYFHSSPFMSVARGHQLCVSEAGVQWHRRGDAASCLRRLQRLHICIRPDGSGQKLHHDGTTGERRTRDHTSGSAAYSSDWKLEIFLTEKIILNLFITNVFKCDWKIGIIVFWFMFFSCLITVKIPAFFLAVWGPVHQDQWQQ